MSDCLIYGLRDPRTDEYKYIGKSNVGIKRAHSHLTFSHNESVNLWVYELRERSLAPCIDIIEHCDEDNLAIKEQFWVRFYEEKVGCKLFNVIKYRGFDFEIFKQGVEEERKKLVERLESIREQVVEFNPTMSTLKQKRRKMCVSQDHLAEMIGVSTRTIRNIEQGDFTKCAFDTIRDYVETLGYSLVLVNRLCDLNKI